MRQVTHPQHQDDYRSGYEAMQARIRAIGWKAAHAEFQAAHPIGYRPASLAAYYHADGQVDALAGTR